MKAKIGMRVSGECDVGVIIAMTPQWCIYKTSSGDELAEPWESMVIEIEKPEEVEGNLKEEPDIPTEFATEES